MANSPLRDTIQSVLNETGGNVKATAMRLGVSDTYVRDVAKEIPPAELAMASEPQAELHNPIKEFMAALITPNNEAIIELRDSSLGLLQEKVDNDAISTNMLIRVARMLLEYETAQRAIARPVANIKYDQRTQHQQVDIQMLVQQVEKLPVQTLREIVGTAVPEIIDGTSGAHRPSPRP